LVDEKKVEGNGENGGTYGCLTEMWRGKPMTHCWVFEELQKDD
jgi:hypothetical protein